MVHDCSVPPKMKSLAPLEVQEMQWGFLFGWVFVCLYLPTWKYKGGESCSMGLERWTLHRKTAFVSWKSHSYCVLVCTEAEQEKAEWRDCSFKYTRHQCWATPEDLETNIKYLTVDKGEKSSKTIWSLSVSMQHFTIYFVHFLRFLVKFPE